MSAMDPGMTPAPVDPDAIDRQFQQLESEAKLLEDQITKFGQKLRQAAEQGDYGARVWVSELRLIAMQVKAEQDQMHQLLQGMHALTAYALHQAEQAQAGGGYQQQAPGGSPGAGGSPAPQQSYEEQYPGYQSPAYHPQQAPQEADPSGVSTGQIPGQGGYPQPPGAQASYAQYPQQQYQDQLAQQQYEDQMAQQQQQDQPHGLRGRLAGLTGGGGALSGVAGMLGLRMGRQQPTRPGQGMQVPAGTRGAYFGMRSPNLGRGSGGRYAVQDDPMAQGGYGGGYGQGGGYDPNYGGGGYGGGGGIQQGTARRFMTGRMGRMVAMGAAFGISEEVFKHL